ncbi:unnamed protein product [Alternaria alternata]
MAARAVTAVGQGFSSFRDEGCDTVVTGKVEMKPHGGIDANIQVCTSMTDVYSALNIDASVEANCSFGSFDDRLEYTRSFAKSTTSVLIMVVANRFLGTEEITGTKFKEDYKWILDSANDLYFVGGDSFVATTTLGGQYIAFYQFDAETVEERDQLANSAHASAHNAGFSLQARLDTTITNASSYTGSKYSFFQAILGQSHGKLPDSNNIGQFALNFGTAELDAPIILNFTTQSYNTVEGRPKMTHVDKLRSIFANRMHPAKGLGTIRVTAQHALDSIAIVRAIYDLYGCRAADKTLDARQTTYRGYIDVIDNWQSGVEEDVENAHPPVPMIWSSKDSQRPLEATDIQMPAASYAIMIGPGAGGNWGGDPFDNVPSNAILRQMRVTGIEVWSGKCINSIRTRVQSEIDGSTETPTAGHPGGSMDNGMWDLSNMSQVIQEVSVHYSTDDWLCKEITIVTNQRKYQTHAGEGDRWATWTAQSGTDCFLGFAGRFGDFANRLMVKFVRFAPATWE